jgi:ubiquinone/menaquinone biosynthesis C-methylase UbiE
MICDYEGSDYKTRFWQNADRAYEDAVERIALRRLLPARGARIVEFGAGFGRLADLYTGYDDIILLDYSRTLLEQARERWGSDPRFKFVAADINHLPFGAGVMNSATMVRVIHHIANVPAALAEIRRVMNPGAVYVLEFANKRNLKAMARYVLRRQAWSPFAHEPVEFVKLNYDFHPAWMAEQLQQAGFNTQRRLPVSYLRTGALKRVAPVQAMVYADALLQLTAPAGLWSPSVFTRNVAVGGGQPALSPLTGEGIFRSPHSGQPLVREGETLVCPADGTRWMARGNFYDFKEPLA